MDCLTTHIDGKFIAEVKGSGSGKSYFVTQKLILKLLRESKRKLLVVRKTGTSLKDSCWALFMDILSRWQILDMCKVNKTTFTIELPNGSQILMKGL